jgi:DDE superfamily endonuclease
LKKPWGIPPDANAECVCAMAEILDVYHRPSSPDHPLVCLDEASTQQVMATRQPLTAEPGQIAHYDDDYERNGVSNLFMFFAPVEGWRHVKVTAQRTKVDFAYCSKDWLTVHSPEAERVTIVLDNLNTQHPSSL